MGPPCLLAKRLMASPPEPLLRGQCVQLDVDAIDAITDANEPKLEIPKLDYDLIGELFDHALGLGHANDEGDSYRLDQWLAPRLHSVLRVPRRIASQRRFWAWIAVKFAPEYVFDRFSEDGVVSSWRYTGGLLRNAVARLWWAAELLRNGADYSTVELGLHRVRTAQFALELMYSWFRPAAIAFVKVAEDPSDRLTDAEMKALSVRANAYLPLLPLEAVGFSSQPEARDEVWWESGPTKKDLFATKAPAGPNDGVVEPVALAAVVKWYRDVIVEERAAAKVGTGLQE